GVHLTRMMDGSVTVGPNAVLGFAREGYPKFSFNLQDVAEYSTFPGFWKTILRNIQHGLKEMKNSIFKGGYLEACRKYCPSLEIGDLLPYEAGIRAQAVMKDGTLVHDFLFLETARIVRRRIICESFSAIYEWWRISLCSTIVCCRGLRPKTTVC